MTPTDKNHRLLTGVRIAGWTATLMGGYWLVMWLAGLAALRSASVMTPKTNMALCQLLGGVALLLLGRTTLTKTGRTVGLVLACVMLLVGVLTISEHFFQYDFGIDQLLASEAPGAIGTTTPNRMGILGTTSLLLLGVAFIALALRRPTLAPYLGLMVVLLNLVPTIGYLYGAEELFTVPRLTGIAWQSVVALTALGIGIILAVREHGPLALLLRQDAGGMLLRKMLPPAILLPLLMGYVRLRGHYLDWYDLPMGTGLLVILLILFFLLFLWRSASHLSRTAAAEAETHRALWQSEENLRRLNDELEQRVAEQTEEIRRVNIVLEQRVAERTAELQAANTTLHDARLAALNVMEDAIAARARAEKTGTELQAEIAERTRAEEALRRDRQTFIDLVEGSPFGMYIVDSGFCIAHMNPGSQKGTFQNVRPVIGRNFSEAMHTLWPEAVADEMIGHFRHTLDTGEPYYSPRFTHPRADIWGVESYEWELHRISLPSGEHGVVCYYFDSTKLRNAEQAMHNSQKQLSLIIDTAMDGIVSLDQDRRIIIFNDAAVKMFGYYPSEVIGQPYTVLLPESMRSGSQEYPALKTGQRRSGEEFPIEASLSQIELGGKKFSTIIIRDVTERHRIEHERLRLREELERRVEERTRELAAANKELETFSYTVSHDLKAPLRAIMGFSWILLEKAKAKLDAQEQRHLDVIATSASEMSHLIDVILSFSRLGKQALKPSEIHMEALARSVVEEQQANQERMVEISIGTLPPVRADGALIKQVLVNLISNAFKFTRNTEHPVIEIGSTPQDGEIVYYVRDNGAGFDMKLADKLFGVFQRLHDAGQYEGSGVGLAFSKRIVERHGGRMWGHGKVNEGATFYLALPNGGSPAQAAEANDAGR